MKLLVTLSLLLAAPLAWAATTFPAATNAPNYFYKSNTMGDITVMKKPVIIEDLTTTRSLQPSADDQHNLGGALLRYKHGYLAEDLFFGHAFGNGSGITNLAEGVVTGPLLSASPTTNGPSAAEFATAGWVRGLFSNGIIDYTTTNIDGTATNPGTAGQPVYIFSANIPPSDFRTYTAPNAGDYLGSVITTNTFTFLQGPVDVSAYLAASGGSGNPSISIHPEIYYTYDKSNLFGDWVAANQLITIGTTNLYQWVVTFPAIMATNATGFHLERRFKVGSAAGATHPTIRVLVGTNSVSGTNDGSHIDFTGPSSQIGTANLNNNQTFTGTNTFTNLTIFEGDTIFNTIIRGKVYMTNSILFTNSMTQTINFGTNISYSEGVFATNAAFAWLGFQGISGNIAQTAVVWLTNQTGVVWDFTVPANCHTKGILNCTNVSELVFKCYGNQWTNLLSLPLW